MAHFDEPHPFSLDSATLHYAADVHVRARSLKLELDVDFETRSIRGVATHTLEALVAVKELTGASGTLSNLE